MAPGTPFPAPRQSTDGSHAWWIHGGSPVGARLRRKSGRLVSVLEGIPDHSSRRRVYRLAVAVRSDGCLPEMDFDADATDELRAFLPDSAFRWEGEAMLDNFFERGGRLGDRTRFSDGSFPVFYSSLDSATTEAEVKHWAPTLLGGPGRPRTEYRWLFRCTFDGSEKDLRPQIGTWPNLVHDSDYTFCNRLGAEAVELGVDGLVTWSARRADGVNVPVFSRGSLSEPEGIRLVVVTYDPATSSVSIRPVSE